MNYNANIRFYNRSGIAIGELDGDCLVKTVRSSAHMLRNPRGWTWDVAVLDDAREAGATWTRIHDEDTGRVYTASLEAFEEYGKKIDRGYGEQVCLPFKYWQVKYWQAHSLISPTSDKIISPISDETTAPVQLLLWSDNANL